MAISIPVNPGFSVIWGKASGVNGHRIRVWAEYLVGSADPVSNTTWLEAHFYAALDPSFTSATRASYGLDSALWVGEGKGTGVANGPYDFTSANNLHRLGSYEGSVPHNADGTAIVTLSGSFTTNSTYISGGSFRQDLPLPVMTRETGLGATDAYIGQTSIVALSVQNPEFTHTISYQFGNLSGYLTDRGLHSDVPMFLAATGLAFPIPESFYDQLTDSDRAICTLTCCTYLGEDPIGQPQTATFTVRADPQLCSPQVTVTLEDITPETLALTGDPKTLVAGLSTARCCFTVKTHRGATVAAVTIQGQSLTGDSVDLPQVATLPQIQVVDSRGFTAQATDPQAKLIAYAPVTNLAQISRDTPTGDRATLTFSGSMWQGSFGLAENALTLEYSLEGGPWVTVTAPVTLGGGRYAAACSLEGLDYTRSYRLQTRVTDRLTQRQRELLLQRGVPVFDWGEGDFAFHVPVSAPELNAPVLQQILQRLNTLEEKINGEY